MPLVGGCARPDTRGRLRVAITMWSTAGAPIMCGHGRSRPAKPFCRIADDNAHVGHDQPTRTSRAAWARASPAPETLSVLRGGLSVDLWRRSPREPPVAKGDAAGLQHSLPTGRALQAGGGKDSGVNRSYGRRSSQMRSLIRAHARDFAEATRRLCNRVTTCELSYNKPRYLVRASDEYCATSVEKSAGCRWRHCCRRSQEQRFVRAEGAPWS